MRRSFLISEGCMGIEKVSVEKDGTQRKKGGNLGLGIWAGGLLSVADR